MGDFNQDEGIGFEAVIAQLQHENEELRVKLTQAKINTPLSEAVDNVAVLVKHTNPFELYIWVAILCAILLVVARFIEVLWKRD